MKDIKAKQSGIKNAKREPEDFGSKWVGKKCMIILNDNSVINAKVTDNSKYYLEIINIANNKVEYIHKEYIKKIVIEE